jgi:hypothetical protein
MAVAMTTAVDDAAAMHVDLTWLMVAQTLGEVERKVLRSSSPSGHKKWPDVFNRSVPDGS